MMFFSTPMSSGTRSSYDLLQSVDIFLPISGHRFEDMGVSSGWTLRDVLAKACREHSSSAYFMNTANGRCFLVWTARTGLSSTNSVDNALGHFQNFITTSRESQTSVLFNSKEVVRENKDSGEAVLAILVRYDASLARSLGLPAELQHQITHTRQLEQSSDERRTIVRVTSLLVPTSLSKTQLCLTAALTVLILILVISLSSWLMQGHAKDMYHSWIAYDTSGSAGPKYQLPITGQNASFFTASALYKSTSWTLRIDDQALIQTSLLSDEEAYYQEYFKAHFPEMDKLRLNGDHVNQTWLSSPAVDEVPTDDLFHLSHCVLALRRYIRAKETGTHVCGRDISREHMWHCLDSLDWWAFPENRTESLPNPKRTFYWRTKVCFD